MKKDTLTTKILRKYNQVFSKTEKDNEMLKAQYRYEKQHSESLERKIKELQPALEDIASKIAKVSIEKPMHLRDRYRLCIDLDSYMIESSFMHGNDHLSIDYLGQYIGRMAACELTKMNYKRTAR